MNLRLSSLFAFAIIGSLFVLSSGCRHTDMLAPPAVHWGQDTCQSCGMILSDPRYAGAVVLRRTPEDDVEYHLFDDMGEMLAWTPPTAVEIRWYAADFNSGRWIDAATATFLRNAAGRTPMSTGFIAFDSQLEAEKTRREGTEFSFAAARQSASAHPFVR